MNLDEKSPTNLLVKALLIITFSAATTAALSNETWKTVFKNFIAGVSAGIVVFLIGDSAKLSEAWLMTLCCIMSAFVSVLWPLVGVIAKKYVNKKGNDILSNDK